MNYSVPEIWNISPVSSKHLRKLITVFRLFVYKLLRPDGFLLLVEDRFPHKFLYISVTLKCTVEIARNSGLKFDCFEDFKQPKVQFLSRMLLLINTTLLILTAVD